MDTRHLRTLLSQYTELIIPARRAVSRQSHSLHDEHVSLLSVDNPAPISTSTDVFEISDYKAQPMS